MDIEQINAAADRLAGWAIKTPLLHSPMLDSVANRHILLKPECLQHTGSFKYRGAFSAISSLAEHARARGVIAFSSGNHAQGIALAASQHNCPSVIVMPRDAPKLKIANTRKLGSELVLYDRVKESREEIAARIAKKRDLTLIKPYDEPTVIAGQGTIGLEIADQALEYNISNADVLVCCGGGGLTSGIALSLEARSPGLRPRTCEPAGFDDTARSLRAGKILSNKKQSGGLCDAILAPCPGELTFPIMRRLCGPGIVVTEKQAMHAMALAFQHLKLVLEPGGAVALAAALFVTTQHISDPVIVVLSGGNVDTDVFQRALSAGEKLITPQT